METRRSIAAGLVGAAVVAALMAAAIAGDTPAEEAIKKLPKAAAAKDLNATRDFVSTLVAYGGPASARAILDLIPKVPPVESDLYWLLVKGAAGFQEKTALEKVGDFVIENKGSAYARDILFAMQGNHDPNVLAVLGPVLEKGAADLKLMAAEQLANIPTDESVDALVGALKREEKKDSELRAQIVRALQAITGEDLGDRYPEWSNWWAANRGKGFKKPGEGGSGGGGTVVRELDRFRRRSFEAIEKGAPGRVVCIRGEHADATRFDHNFDHIERMLENMNVPHTVVTKEEFEAGKPDDLDDAMAITVNCMMWREHCLCPKCQPGGTPSMRLQQCTGCTVHNPKDYKFTQKAIDRIRAFVEAGGYLFTEDWQLEELVGKAWPQFVKHGKYLNDEVVEVNPAPGRTSHPYLRRVFTGPPKVAPDPGPDGPGGSGGTVTRRKKEFEEELLIKHKWKIDKDSPAIKVVDKVNVAVLMVSKKLADLADGDDAVAVAFGTPYNPKPGSRPETSGGGGPRRRGGMVLHVLSHFGKQESERDEYSLQNLLVNFLIEANRANPERTLKKPSGKGGKEPEKDAGKEKEGNRRT